MKAAPDPLIVNAELEVAPHGDPFDDAAYTLTWHIKVGGGRPAAGPAGVAALRPPGSNLVAWFDYSRPGRLLEVSAPYGTAEMGEEHIDDLDIAGHGQFSSDDIELLDLLLGPWCRAEIQAARTETLSTAVGAQPAWPALGRVALIDAYLDRSDARPVDGLWALEQAAQLRPLARSGGLQKWAAELVDRARPVLRILDPAWAELARRDRSWAELERCLGAAREVAGGDLGSLAAELRKGRTDETLRQLAQVVDEELRPAISELAGVAIGGSQFKSAPAKPTTASGFEPKMDFSVQDLLLGASAQLDRARLRVTVTPARDASAIGSRFEIRVSSSSGQLLAGTLTMTAGDDRLLSSELTLPPGVDESDLFVVVGRHLPLHGFNRQKFDRRQAIERSARALDAARRHAAGDEVDTAEVGRQLWHAQLLWHNAGEYERAAQLRDVPVPEPFLAERLRARGRRLEPTPTDREGDLAAYRSFLWSLGRVPEAARVEASRLRTQPRAEGLSERALEALALAARQAGDAESAHTLEEAALEVLWA